jgi:hypothetical protein
MRPRGQPNFTIGARIKRRSMMWNGYACLRPQTRSCRSTSAGNRRASSLWRKRCIICSLQCTGARRGTARRSGAIATKHYLRRYAELADIQAIFNRPSAFANSQGRAALYSGHRQSTGRFKECAP